MQDTHIDRRSSGPTGGWLIGARGSGDGDFIWPLEGRVIRSRRCAWAHLPEERGNQPPRTRSFVFPGSRGHHSLLSSRHGRLSLCRETYAHGRHVVPSPPAPHDHNVPFVFIEKTPKADVAILYHVVSAPTWTGLDLAMLVLSPISPEAFLPHDHNVPLVLRATVCLRLAATKDQVFMEEPTCVGEDLLFPALSPI